MKPLFKQVLAYSAALFFLALFTSAGFWQLSRARFKDQWLADFKSAGSADPVPFEHALTLVSERGFVPTELRGHYLAQRNILLDNQIQGGQVGVQVYTPWMIAAANGADADNGRADGGPAQRAILIARGFLPLPRDRSKLPDPSVTAGTSSLRGILTRPPASGLQLGDAPTEQVFPLLRTAIEPKALEATLGVPLLAYVLLLNPDQPDGFARNWQPVTMTPERHRGYALQWFSLAAAVLVTTILLTLRAGRRPPQFDPS